VIRAMARMAKGVESRPDLGLPRPAAFEGLHLNLGPEALQCLARGTSNLIRQQQQPAALWKPDQMRPAGERIRLAYLSNDFGRHPTSQLIHRILANHDRNRFELHVYALNKDDGSPIRQGIVDNVEHFEDCFAMDVAGIARKIHADQIDVLVGLGGHTAGRVMEIAMCRPAPVQINYLSFCGTTGAPDAFDVHIADPVSTPPELARCYDERVEYLPNGHYAYDDSRTVGPAPLRSDVGLPEDSIILCGFNNSYKIEPEVFEAWCQILQAVPESILWLFQWHRDQPDNLWAEAARRGIGSERIIFAQPISGDNYLDRLGCADIFIDTFTYNGHTSMLDVLYAGVPAVTRRGPTSPGRIASAFLHEAGLSEWIADSTADYVNKIVALARAPKTRALISKQLQDLRERKAAPFGSELRCRELEALYTRLHDTRCAGISQG
jgi:protein O-GlcNAc transferase